MFKLDVNVCSSIVYIYMYTCTCILCTYMGTQRNIFLNERYSLPRLLTRLSSLRTFFRYPVIRDTAHHFPFSQAILAF